MKYTLSALIILLTIKVSAQTIQVEEKMGYKTLIYNVKSQNKEVKEGPYTVLNYNLKPDCEGFYHNDKKDSLWVYYNFRGEPILSGAYKNDDRVGIWSVIKTHNDTILRYDYSKMQVISYKATGEADSSLYTVYSGKDTLVTKLDRIPIYLEGYEMIIGYISKNIRYPAAAREATIAGRVMVVFKINTDGSVSDYRILRPVQKDLNEESLRIVKSLPGVWLPGILNGKPVGVDCIVPVSFVLAH